MQIYSQIREDIIHKIYTYNNKLPSKRFLASEIGVSVISVSHAYDILCDEGYAEARERSGYFVTYKENDMMPVVSKNKIVSYKNHHTKNEDFPFSILAKTMRKVISIYSDELLIKSPNQGLRELRNSISEYLARSRGINAKPEQIVIGSGAEYLYTLALQILGRDKLYAIESPSYDKIRKVYLANDVKPDMLKMGTEGIKSNELKRTKAEVLHITPFNSFPSGITATASKRNEYIRWIKERNGFIIEDDFDSEFTLLTKPEETLFSLSNQKSVIYINTFSKTIAPSMRIGYMVLPSNLTEKYHKKVGFYSCTVPVFEQYVISEFISSGDFERHINRTRRKRRRKKYTTPK